MRDRCCAVSLSECDRFFLDTAGNATIPVSLSVSRCSVRVTVARRAPGVVITEQLDPEDESDATAKVQVNILCERHGPDNSTIGEQQVLAPPKENEAVKVASSLGLQGPAAPIGAQLLASGGPEDHASATVYHANLVAGTSSTIALQQPLLTSLNPAAALAGMQASAEANSLDFQAMQSMEWIFKKERMYLLTQFWQQVRVTTQSPKLQNFDIFVCFCFFFFQVRKNFSLIANFANPSKLFRKRVCSKLKLLCGTLSRVPSSVQILHQPHPPVSSQKCSKLLFAKVSWNCQSVERVWETSSMEYWCGDEFCKKK